MAVASRRLAEAREEGWEEWIVSEADRKAVADGYWFDIEAAERVRTFFRKFLRHSKGEWAKRPFELLDWQWEQVVGPLFGWKRPDGSRRFRRGYIEVPKKNGKALALDTPLRTPEGWTAMGDVRPGDTLFDENGETCCVLAISEVMHDRLCYRVRFSDGTSLVADAEHEWLTIPQKPMGAAAIRTTAEVGDTLTAGHLVLARSGSWRIVSAERVPSVPVRCIQVDSASHLYLAGDGMVPTHNSALFSGLSLYLLAGDKEPGAEIYSAAVDRDQASIVYNEAANMVDASPHLSSRLKVIRSTKRITFQDTKSFYRALSADVPAKEGLNAHAVLIDELHAQKNRDLRDTLRYAGASRTQPLHLSITTAGYDRHSICWEQHDYAQKVLDGTIEDLSFFGLILGAGEEDDWTNPEVWKKANPSFGVTIREDQFAEDCREAQESPAKENSFRRYRLNQWTEQDVRWLKLEKWDACGAPLGNLDGRECYAGLDLSSTTDISALVLVFPSTERFDVLPLFWIPEEGARQRERRDGVPYPLWIRQGHIEATPGEVIDYDRIRRKINELGKRYNLREIALDRWNATQLSTQLTGDGFEIVAFGQGYASMNWPTKKLEEVVLAGKLAHGGHPVLRWMASNVSIETDAADNWKPSKKKSVERIDGVVALIMGLERATTQPAPFRSVYEERGMMTL